MFDRIEKLGRSTIQHGKRNGRIYLMKLHEDDMPGILPELDRLARENAYSKIFVKVPEAEAGAFERWGYRREARIPGFYNRSKDAVFLGRFMTKDRAEDPRDPKRREILELALQKHAAGVADGSVEAPRVEKAKASDAAEMSEVYREVFPSYPFPIHDPEYLRETMRSHVAYFCIRSGGKIVSLSSAEMDTAGRNVEMTDFATLPEARGAGHAVHLLDRMEDEMVNRDIATAYTIARSMSPGMNITFSRMGYIYAGTLVNNTDIGGSIESMNIWYKHL